MPTPIGLEHNGNVLLKPFCPPYYRDMEEAVLAFLDYKYAEGRGTFRDGGAVTGWRDGAAIQAEFRHTLQGPSRQQSPTAATSMSATGDSQFAEVLSGPCSLSRPIGSTRTFTPVSIAKKLWGQLAKAAQGEAPLASIGDCASERLCFLTHWRVKGRSRRRLRDSDGCPRLSSLVVRCLSRGDAVNARRKRPAWPKLSIVNAWQTTLPTPVGCADRSNPATPWLYH